jgi:endo-1,4-beta-D-glucanase Y
VGAVKRDVQFLVAALLCGCAGPTKDPSATPDGVTSGGGGNAAAQGGSGGAQPSGGSPANSTGGTGMAAAGTAGTSPAGGSPMSSAGAPNLTCPSGANGAGPNKPFPQHVGYPGCADCLHPKAAQATLDADVVHLYEEWKKNLLLTWPSGPLAGENFISAGANGNIDGWMRGIHPCTQSEGHGYGMLTFALMAGHDPDAKKIFDSLDRVRKAFPSSSDPRLMSWALPETGDTTLKSQPPATDGDQDMAYALLLAYDQWGDEPHNHYLAEASSVIAGMEDKYITSGSGAYFPRLNIGDPNHLGSVAPESKPFLTRPSDYMVDHFRAFHAATGHAVWTDLEKGSLGILDQVKNPSTGLVPDFVVADPPQPSTTGTGDEDLCYACFDYNSCRVPWRQAVAVAHYGVAGSRALLGTMVKWASAKFAGDPTLFTAGFQLDGTPEPGVDYTDAAFTSPIAAAGIATADQTWVDNGWAAMKDVGGDDYYGGSITLLSMLLVSGNWWLPSGAACTPVP